MKLLCKIFRHKVDIIYDYKKGENVLFCPRCGETL